MFCVDLPESALFSSFGVICLQPLPSALSGEFSMERMNISGLFSRYKVCSFSDRCYNSTNSSLITVGYQLRFLALLCARSADLACMWYYCVVPCNQLVRYGVFLWLL
jgi:hypothetical protein